MRQPLFRRTYAARIARCRCVRYGEVRFSVLGLIYRKNRLNDIILIKSVWAVRIAQRYGLFYYLHIFTMAIVLRQRLRLRRSRLISYLSFFLRFWFVLSLNTKNVLTIHKLKMHTVHGEVKTADKPGRFI